MPKSDPPVPPPPTDAVAQDPTYDFGFLNDPDTLSTDELPDESSDEWLASIDAIFADPQDTGTSFAPFSWLPMPQSFHFAPAPPSFNFAPTPPSPNFAPTPPSPLPNFAPTPPSPLPNFAPMPQSFNFAPTPPSPLPNFAPSLVTPPSPLPNFSPSLVTPPSAVPNFSPSLVTSPSAVPSVLATPPSPVPATPPPSSTNIIMGCNPFTTGLTLKASHFRKRTFDPNASDSESEAEDPPKKVQKVGNKNPVLVTEAVNNFTKREGRQKKKGKFITKRDSSGRRIVPGVNNWIDEEKHWPDLEADAKAIHDVIPATRTGRNTDQSVANQTFGATTIVCAVLDTDEGYRKFAFCNGDGVMLPELRAEAKRRGYHVVKAMQSHAEGQMIQYASVYKRRKIVSMGCDKPHCAECTYIMQKYLGQFHTQTATSNKTFQNYYMPQPLIDATGLKYRPQKLPGWTPGMMPTPTPVPAPTTTPTTATPTLAATNTPAPTVAPTNTPNPTNQSS